MAIIMVMEYYVKIKSVVFNQREKEGEKLLMIIPKIKKKIKNILY